MTEGEWLAATEPRTMLAFLEGKVSERKLRLFACAWWRTIQPHEERHEVVADRLEQGGRGIPHFLHACLGVSTVQGDGANLLRDLVGNPFRPATLEGYCPACQMRCFAWWGRSRCCDRPAWGPLTDTILSLAEALYEERAFDCLPILADALEEAGCDNQDILRHCRGPGPHARGCWVVDLILGKE